jgi:hypothetical protein
MKRIETMLIAAVCALALVSTQSSFDTLRAMAWAAGDEWVEATSRDHSGVNLDPMNVDGMLALPYVEGTRRIDSRSRAMSRASATRTPSDSATVSVRPTRARPTAPPVLTYASPVRWSKRFTG